MEMEFFQGHKFEVWSLVLFEEKNMMISTGYDQKLILWDLDKKEILGTIKTLNKFNQTLNFHNKFQQIFVGDDEGFIQKFEFSQFESPELINRRKQRQSINVLKGYQNIPQKQVEFMNIKEWL